MATGDPMVAYDRLGFGRSDPYLGTLSFDFVAMEAEHIVPLVREQRGIACFIACRHSVGGGMAVETAARFPDDCFAVVTMGAQAFVEDRTLDGFRRAKTEFTKAENLSRLEKYHGEKARWIVDAWTDTWLAPAFAGGNLDNALTRLRCPVLAIHGELDEYGSVEHPRRIAAGRGNVKIRQGVGHVPHREHEAGILGIIRQFLSDTSRLCRRVSAGGLARRS